MGVEVAACRVEVELGRRCVVATGAGDQQYALLIPATSSRR